MTDIMPNPFENLPIPDFGPGDDVMLVDPFDYEYIEPTDYSYLPEPEEFIPLEDDKDFIQTCFADELPINPPAETTDNFPDPIKRLIARYEHGQRLFMHHEFALLWQYLYYHKPSEATVVNLLKFVFCYINRPDIVQEGNSYWKALEYIAAKAYNIMNTSITMEEVENDINEIYWQLDCIIRLVSNVEFHFPFFPLIESSCLAQFLR